MKLTAKLAYSQIKMNLGRTNWTLAGIALSTAMISAVCGLIASANEAFVVVLGDNYYDRGVYLGTLIGAGSVLCAIIVAASVIVISNAFRVSAGERTRQFGILKSVGATKKQIASTVMYEGLWLSAIGIPLGIIAGLFVEFAFTSIANYFLIGLNKINDRVIEFSFIIAWQAIIIAAVVAFITVLLSAWLPARKASKIAAIDAIRNSGEVKLSAKKIKTSKLTNKLFGFEGALAAKSLKRSKRNFRATVVSLTISIVLFLSASSLGVQVGQMSNLLFPSINATAEAEYSTSVTFAEMSDDGKYLKNRNYSPLDVKIANEITEKLKEFDNSIFAIGGDSFTYTAYLPKEMLTPRMRTMLSEEPLETYEMAVALVTVDAENYAALCKKAGVALGSNILVNHFRGVSGGKKAEFEPFVFRGQTAHFEDTTTSETRDVPLHGELPFGEIPNEIMYFVGPMTVIVPELPALNYIWFTSTENPGGFVNYANTVLDELVPKENPTEIYTDSVDIHAATEAIRSTSKLVMVFIYSFVGMLTLIGLTNVISTISTNVRSRSREFAVLKSVGMTQKGLGQMLNLESILCSFKSLLYGLPLGIAAAILIANALSISVEIGGSNRFTGANSIIPWFAVLECVLGVFAVTWITMRYSAGRLRGKSIVEAIRE
jgi:putative ABC transport system permease protein